MGEYSKNRIELEISEKQVIQGLNNKDKVSEHLSEYMWRKDIRENNRNAFEVLIEDINYSHSSAVTKEQ